jgi:general secretion pathway protein G
MNRGFTLIELLVSVAIISILASVTIPISKITVVRSREYELKSSLREIRDAIDKFKYDFDGVKEEEKYSDADPFKEIRDVIKGGYPGSLDQLKGFRYLRRIPKDPMSSENTNGSNFNWGIVESDEGVGIYDIYSKSQKTALDGTKYREW